ncbi:hypothetical protein DOTSEDRAFT_68613 [Dothistroma septosporum NZE10]|uniref:F-box domain-containing protein n=1 Tax=Dothistroma septosporum (strain NZE10 / CBS 128990) TaxID=675120 RepID=N1Q4T0_DOTSN|nr:hypothetical protein DOTSEDRAFT_68613 [Dothistroma septosporum NZE10]
MSLLKLPNELLDHISSYLDWDCTKQLYPVKDDLISASVTCRRLRAALIPSIFKEVNLRLRWVGGELAEPSLYKLRVQSPRLMKHIRCVTVSTEREECAHCAQKDHCRPFVPPHDQQDWLLTKDEEQSHLGMEHRARVDTLARSLTADVKLLDGRVDISAERIISAARATKLGCPKLDCLTIVMLCIPPNTQSIILNCALVGRPHQGTDGFCMKLLATCMDVLAEKLQEVTLVSMTYYNRSRRQIANNASAMQADEHLPASLLSRSNIQRLILAFRENNQFSASSPALSHQAYKRWQTAPIRELDLRYMRADMNEVLKLTEDFPALETIRIRDCVLFLTRHSPNRQELERHIWLQLAIELRRQIPNGRIELSNLCRPWSHDQLTESAVRWIVQEAIPKGAIIDADREQRLTDDFLSFSFLWTAEEEERGAQALGANELWASLSDEAMTRRWR